MNAKPLALAAFVALSIPGIKTVRGDDAGGSTANKLVIHADQGKATISKNIYGHFAEHLGHCIYGGIWVGEDSPIPNTRTPASCTSKARCATRWSPA